MTVVMPECVFFVSHFAVSWLCCSMYSRGLWFST